MFTSASKLHTMNRSRDKKVHCIGFEWNDTVPMLYGYDLLSKEIEAIDLNAIDHHITGRRQCVGSGSYTDGYRPCPHGASIGSVVQCPMCIADHIPRARCIFEPECDGEKCGADFCSQPHVVYLAFFGETLKVGMSSAWRVRERIIEQGVDAYSILGKFPTRRWAREEEKFLSSSLQVRQLLREKDVLASFFIPFSRWEVMGKYTELSNIARALGYSPSPLKFIDNHPLPRLNEEAFLVYTPGPHRGRKVGSKGRFLIYESNENKELFALDMQDIVGRYLYF